MADLAEHVVHDHGMSLPSKSQVSLPSLPRLEMGVGVLCTAACASGLTRMPRLFVRAWAWAMIFLYF